MYPKTIEKLIELFSKFPGVGPRTAARFVFYLTKREKKELEELSKAISSISTSLRRCNFCFNLFQPSQDSQVSKDEESGQGLCEICSNQSRNRNLLCVVEKEIDLISIERNKIYKGLYFVLGGTVSGLRKKDFKSLRLSELRERIKNPEKFGIKNASFEEIIIAFSSTVEGEATILFLERKLKDLNKKITRLGRGLPTGGELEYADRETLSSAFSSRKSG